MWSRRPPLRFSESCLAREGVGDSGGSCQRGRVGAAHTNRWTQMNADKRGGAERNLRVLRKSASYQRVRRLRRGRWPGARGQGQRREGPLWGKAAVPVRRDPSGASPPLPGGRRPTRVASDALEPHAGGEPPAGKVMRQGGGRATAYAGYQARRSSQFKRRSRDPFSLKSQVAF